MKYPKIKALLFWVSAFIGISLALNIFGLHISFYHASQNKWITFAFSLFIALVVYLIVNRQKKQKNNSSNLPPVSKSKEKFYLGQGLTVEEMEFFRQTMNDTRIQIIELEETVNRSPRLNTINHRYQTIETSKNFFQTIVKNPLKLAQVSDFLYRDLPDLVTLSKKFLEIEAHPNKNKATLQVIDKSANKIEQLCQTIENEYLTFQEEELNTLHSKINAQTLPDVERENEIHE